MGFKYCTVVTIILQVFATSAKIKRGHHQQHMRDLEKSPPVSLDTYRKSVESFLEELNAGLEDLDRTSQLLNWERSVNINEEIEDRVREAHSVRSKWMDKQCQVVKNIRQELLEDQHRRMLRGLCNGPSLDAADNKNLSMTSSKLQDIYATTRVNLITESYRGEPDLSDIMIESRDYFKLLWAWSEWRRAVGPPCRALYAEMVELMNKGARNAGYQDIGEAWRSELDIPNLEELTDALYEEIRPLYEELHAYARGKLYEFYGPKLISKVKPIPAHILGNMWAQNWQGIYHILLPDGDPEFNVTGLLKSKNFTVMDMVKSAEQYYMSLGLEPLPESFWKYSQFVKPEDGRETSCHGAASNLFGNDVRFMMCAKVCKEDFVTTHHEMGHVYYYLAYRHQPHLFKQGANSAFHEAVGDSIVYAVMSTLNQRVFRNHEPNNSSDISFLLHQALLKLPLLPFSLVMDRWRWDVFRGNIPAKDYNKAWWDLRVRLQGIMPPVRRSEMDFDPAAKHHITDNTPYIRYFLGAILQVQFFDAMCEAAQQGPRFGQQLHRCDIYGSKEAGQRLWSMMSLGSSQPWQTALKVMTNGRSDNLDSRPLLEYYRPLYDWLKLENKKRGFTYGWTNEVDWTDWTN